MILEEVWMGGGGGGGGGRDPEYNNLFALPLCSLNRNMFILDNI